MHKNAKKNECTLSKVSLFVAMTNRFEINSRIEYTVSKECPVCFSSHTRSNFGSCLSNPPNLSSRSSLEWTPIRTSYDGRQAPFFHN